MVFFSCDGCGEMLKKNQVDAHVYRCKNGCHAVSCVDCSVSFYGDDYAAHTSCITEAERYEKKTPSSKQKSQNKKRNPQQEWTDIVATCANSSSATKNPQLQSYLHTMAGLDNIPRKEKQFLNFMSNSLNLRGRHGTDICQQLWNILKQEKDQRMAVKAKEQELQQQQSQQKVESNAQVSSSSASSSDGNDSNKAETATTSSNAVSEEAEVSNQAATSTSTSTAVLAKVDKKTVHKAMKKALKKAPNQSMKVKELRKLLQKEYDIDSKAIKKSQLQQLMESCKKAKIEGKTISLVVSSLKD